MAKEKTSRALVNLKNRETPVEKMGTSEKARFTALAETIFGTLKPLFKEYLFRPGGYEGALERIAKRLDATERAGFIQGHGLAIATIIRSFGCDAGTREVLRAGGYTLADYRAAGLEAYDLIMLKKGLEDAKR